MADEGMHEEDTERLSLEERRAMERAPLDEAGEGESEGFELAEEALIENASHGDQHNTTPILRDASDVAEEIEQIDGEADDEEPRDL